jgi:hypothetical protein
MAELAVLLLVMAQHAPPPASKESPLEVRLVVSPRLAAPGKPPTLDVTVTNQAPRALDVMRFPSDACFAHFFLELSLTLPDGTGAVAADCPIRRWPGNKASLAAGASETRRLALATIFPAVTWGPGRYHLEASWNPAGLAGYLGGAYAWGAEQQSRGDGHFTLAAPLGTVRVEKGKTVTLPDGARLTFAAHGHKRTLEGGPPSPLIIHGAFAAPKQPELKDFDYALHLEETRVFRLDGDATFELVDHAYDAWMELAYFGHLPER